MSDTVTIKRVRVIEYDAQEAISMTADEYQAILAKLGVDDIKDASPQEVDELIYRDIGDEWETDWTEPVGDRTQSMWLSEDDNGTNAE